MPRKKTPRKHALIRTYTDEPVAQRVAYAGEIFSYFSSRKAVMVQPWKPSDSGDHIWVCIVCGMPLFTEDELERHVRLPRIPETRQTARYGVATNHIIAWRSLATGRVYVPYLEFPKDEP